MAPVFIFAEDVQKALRGGKKEIEIPEGARISAAAADLIKENKMRVIAPTPGSKAPKETPPARAAAVPEKAATRKGARQLSDPEPEGGAQPAPSDGEITEEVVEEIVNRVMVRFSELKKAAGRPPSKSAPASGASAAPASAPADDDDLVICRCEEITKGEIKEAIRNGMRTLNGIKRITRAGMGLCQGQTCQQLVARILTEELGLAAADIDPTTARGPVRPLKLAVFANS